MSLSESAANCKPILLIGRPDYNQFGRPPHISDVSTYMSLILFYYKYLAPRVKGRKITMRLFIPDFQKALLTEDYLSSFHKYPTENELELWGLYTTPICREPHLMPSNYYEDAFSGVIPLFADDMGMQYEELVALVKKVAIEFFMVETPFHDPKATSHLGGFIPKKYRKHKELIAALALLVIQIYLRMKSREDELRSDHITTHKTKSDADYADYYLVFKKYPTEELRSLWTSLTLPAVITSQKGTADEYETAFADLLATTAIAVDMGEKELLEMVQNIAANYFRIFQCFRWDERDVRLVDLIPEKYGRNVLNIAALVLAHFHHTHNFNIIKWHESVLEIIDDFERAIPTVSNPQITCR